MKATAFLTWRGNIFTCCSRVEGEVNSFPGPISNSTVQDRDMAIAWGQRRNLDNSEWADNVKQPGRLRKKGPGLAEYLGKA